MTSAAFNKVLAATGYLDADGEAAPGLARTNESPSARLRAVMSDGRVKLQADAVFSAQNVPTSIFKDAGFDTPSDEQVSRWHEAAWNVGIAPLLWIITPTDVRLYNCYASPTKHETVPKPLDVFRLDAIERLRDLDAMCGRFATETGTFWSSAIGKRIDRRHRVDRELLGEINALEELLTRIPTAGESREPQSPVDIQAARDFAQRLIGRCIFTSYLIDRGIAQPFLPKRMAADVANMFATVDSAFALFKWLRRTFNGDLFPMDDPVAEQNLLTKDHLFHLREFIEGRSLVSGQGRLFRFRYDAIPVDLISSIYQQFARSSAAEQAHVQGLHYTPVELVHLTLDAVFEGLPATARVIDPACGSGAFLVEAFRRLVWKQSQGRRASRGTVREVLYNQLYGIDINKAALGIAAFSLYLAALELDEEPVSDIGDLKFDHLIGVTLFNADAVHDELPEPISEKQFDAVVGNPPWTFIPRTAQPRQTGSDETARPRRSPDQAFLRLASDLAGSQGRVGMIMKASPFFSRDPHAVEARAALLRSLAPAALVNLSALRKEQLFPDATGPALLFFSRCTLAVGDDRLLVGSIPWTANFRRNGVFHVGPAEFQTLPLAKVLETPAMLKAATFGTARDTWLIEKLERSHLTLKALLTNEELDAQGQGFQVRGGDNNDPPQHYYRLGVVTPETYTPFRIQAQSLPRFEHRFLHRARKPGIYEGPLLLCPKGNFVGAAQPGRYSAAISMENVLYNESFYGISFADRDPALAQLLCAILNASLTTFQLAFAGATWGLERPTVEPNDLLSLRIPNLKSISPSQVQRVLEAEQEAAKHPEDSSRREALDRAIYELYDLERDEVVLAEEALARARMMVVEKRTERIRFLQPPHDDILARYAGEVIRTVNAYLRAGGKRHMEAILYPHVTRANIADDTPGITAVRFAMAAGGPSDAPVVVVREASDPEIDQLEALFQGQVNSDVPPYLNERRHLRVYLDDDLFVLKPSERRYWTRTAGLNDADFILADHWMTARHAAIA